jgi:hypothetical protein
VEVEGSARSVEFSAIALGAIFFAMHSLMGEVSLAIADQADV